MNRKELRGEYSSNVDNHNKVYISDHFTRYYTLCVTWRVLFIKICLSTTNVITNNNINEC